MNILVSNDDGIQAEGIAKLTEALSMAGHAVYVIAPNGQRSASSHALSIGKDILLRQVEGYPFAKEAYMVDGTPADCVKMGVGFLEKKGICTDMVYTGINHGGNLGTDTMYSGTVSAAAEGAFLGIPAVAVSVDSHTPQHFETACKAAVCVLQEAYRTGGRQSVVSINAPDLPECEIKGMRAAKLGNVKYDEWFFEAERTEDSVTYHYAGTAVEDESWEDDMDTKLIRDGWVTVSMVKYDLNDYDGLEMIKNWEAIK